MASEFAQFVESCLARRASRHPDRLALADTDGAKLDGRGLYERARAVARSLPVPDGASPPLYLLPTANGVEGGALAGRLDGGRGGAQYRHGLPAGRNGARAAGDRAAVGHAGPRARGRGLPASGAGTGAAAMPAGTVLVNCTSGTTGMPKLVYQSAAALRHNGEVSARLMRLEEGEPCLEVRGLNWYSAQILSLMPFLSVGTQLHVAPGFSASRLAGWLDERAIRFMPMVPSMVRIMLGVVEALPEALTRYSCSSSELAGSCGSERKQPGACR